jgi:hypothetical protein
LGPLKSTSFFKVGKKQLVYFSGPIFGSTKVHKFFGSTEVPNFEMFEEVIENFGKSEGDII